MANSDHRSRIAEVNASLERASQCWNASDLDSLEQCRQALDRAVAELSSITHAQVQGGAELVGGEELAAIRVKVRRLLQRIYAATSFNRGLALTLGVSECELDPRSETASPGGELQCLV